MHLEFYINMYGNVKSGSSALDVAHLRRSLPAANAVRLVGILWKDSIKRSDGLECSTDDPSTGYLDRRCLRFLDALVRQLTEAGYWVILTARSKYAAGWDPEVAPDVFHNTALRDRMHRMWRFVADRYKWTDRIAGYEIMSEPRTKTVSQLAVRDFYRGGCDAVHHADPGALCVVGPRPFYKLWELSEAVLQPHRSQTLYTVDFFVPGSFAFGNTALERSDRCSASSDGGQGNETWCRGFTFPGRYECRGVYDTWWRGKPGCEAADDDVLIDERWVHTTLQRHAFAFAKRHGVPIHINQWGVKDAVFDANGRQRYAHTVLEAFRAYGLSSTYWLWREKHKSNRDVHESGVWGFELVHNDGPHEGLDARMLATLQAGFAATAVLHAGNLVPCGAAAVLSAGDSDVTQVEAAHRAKTLAMSSWPTLAFAPPRLPDSGVECDPLKLEARVDWYTLLPPPNASTRIVSYPAPPPPGDRLVEPAGEAATRGPTGGGGGVVVTVETEVEALVAVVAVVAAFMVRSRIRRRREEAGALVEAVPVPAEEEWTL